MTKTDSKNSHIEMHTLPNGLRCVHHHRAGVRVGYFGVAVNAGSRDEQPGQEGLAHFVEHTIFKGTLRRRSHHIINRMEACGGELNAYTTKESTVVYSVFPAGNLSRAAELIADLITHSQFPTAELDKEREVVADEINSYLDMPSEAVYDDFEDLLFADTPLGHNILGTTESLARFDSATCRDYLRRYYVAGNMVLFYDGPDSPATVFRAMERWFAEVSSSEAPLRTASKATDIPFRIRRDLDIHQSHTVIGAGTVDMFSPERHAMALLVNMLGGPGMNSLLNVALREKRGLVYSVDASLVTLTDTGEFTIYYGCDSTDVDRCRRLIEATINRLACDNLTSRRLESAKRQYLGQALVATDNRENSTLAMARAVLYKGRVMSDAQLIETINSITANDIRQAAETLAPERLSWLTFS